MLFDSGVRQGGMLCPTLLNVLSARIKQEIHYINITFPKRVIVENIIPRNVIINLGAPISVLLEQPFYGCSGSLC